MFGGARRHRPPSAPLNSGTANPNATTAATSAFMSAANPNPNKALSSAAAAAALRARPHTPTNVAEVQTKRTIRRSTSVSSSGSGPGLARRPANDPHLERRGSVSSMSDRTFRSPSPHRSSRPAEEEPPVPQIPASHRNSAPDTRHHGTGMQNFRTASQRLAAESHSYYTEPIGDTRNVRTSDAPMRDSKPPPPQLSDIVIPDQSRSSSRSSVNFSYPSTYRVQSPPASPRSPSTSHQPIKQPSASATTRPNKVQQPVSRGEASQQLVYDPNSRRMVPKVQVEPFLEHRARQGAERPARRKEAGLQREGSHLAKGTIARPKGTLVETSHTGDKPTLRQQPVIEALPATQEHPLLEEPAVKALITPGVAQQEGPTTGQSDRRDPRAQSPKSEVTDHAGSGQFLIKSPENQADVPGTETILDDESSELRESAQASQNVLGALDAVETRQAVFENPQIPTNRTEPEHQETPRHGTQSTAPGRSELPESALNEQKAHFAENKPVAELVKTSGSTNRSTSNSPVRQARFASSPSGSLTIKHTPLPRSASPIKSAMKRTETSPSASEPSRSNTVSPTGREEPPMPRKKSVRVSFDDQNTVIVGDSVQPVDTDSPIVPSPQAARRPWYGNLGRNRKKDLVLEDDEVMQPRPALPSFGSIREKKTREPEERPLVRPLESAHSPAVSSSPELRPQSANTVEEPTQLGQSSDHAIGPLLVQDQSSRNPPNISRFREPLPPVVTSVEGNGYNSDIFQSSDSENDNFESSTAGSAIPSIPTTQMTDLSALDSSESESPEPAVSERSWTKPTEESGAGQRTSQNIPLISVIQPTPLDADTTNQASNPSPRVQYFDVPGGFPPSESPSNQSVEDDDFENASSNATIFETPASVHPAQTDVLPQTTLATTEPLQILDDLSTEDSDEVFSDAYEDIPDDEAGGFMSLDAIIESPVESHTKPAKAGISETSRDAEASLVQSQSASAAKGDEGWEHAKAYWRSLTAERRRQLELEAVEDAGAEGDREEVSQPVRRNSSRRKSAEQQLSSDAKSQIVSKPEEWKKTQAQKVAVARNSESSSAGSTAPRMRTSLREAQPAKISNSPPQPQTGMRKTMRANGGAQDMSQRPPRQAAAAPATTVPVTSGSRQNPAARRRPQSAVMSPPESPLSKPAKPALQRRGSDGSESSFKRSHVASTGGFFARRTMRQASPSQKQPESTKDAGRFSLRSLSPTGSSIRHNSINNPATSSPQAGKFKRTLRSNSESSHDVKRSSMHFPSFGKASNKKSLKGSKVSSRFNNSSDEDEEPARPGFSSRFGESSDEDDGRPSSSKIDGSLANRTLRTSAVSGSSNRRPTTTSGLEQDSLKLSDSDDDQVLSPLQSPQSRFQTLDRPALTGRTSSGGIGTSTLATSTSRSGRGGLTTSLTDPGLSPKNKRGSFMGILRRNKRADQAGKITRSDLMESAARRDTKLERDEGVLRDLRGDHQATSPRLQKRNPFDRNDAQPLTGLRNGDTPKRPSSAGYLFGRSNTAGAIDNRPTLAGRRSASLGLDRLDETGEAGDVIPEGTGVASKKKKFGALRRMFKLDE